jgi:hypothetical protein
VAPGDFAGLLEALVSQTPPGRLAATQVTDGAGERGQMEAFAAIMDVLGIVPPASVPGDAAPVNSAPSPGTARTHPQAQPVDGTISIRTVGDLGQLTSQPPLSRTRRRPASVCVQLGALTEAEQMAWSSELTTVYNDCGCTAGAVALLVSVVFSVVRGVDGWTRLGPIRLAVLTLRDAAIASAAGKATGVASRRGRLARAARELSDLASTQG